MNYQNYNYTQKPPQNNNNTGLIIAIAVLACVLVIALIMVVFIATGTIGGSEPVATDTASTSTVRPQQPQQPTQQPTQPQQSVQQPTQPQPQPQPKQPDISSEKTAKKNTFSATAAQIEEYSKNHLETAMTQVEINQESANVFNKWDALLNEVYQYLKTIMPSDEFKQLEKDELNWIAEKESAVKEASAEWAGGTGEPMARFGTATKYTKERCYYLISLIK